MKGIILFKGKYGATEQYATWLGSRLGLKIVQTGSYKKGMIGASDFVILGSSVYMGKLQIRRWVRENLEELASKKIFLFIVCGTPPGETEQPDAYVKGSIPPSLLKQCEVYFLPGKLVYKKLSRTDKFFLRFGAMLAKDKQTKKTMLTDYNSVKKENLNEILKGISQFTGPVTKTAALP